MVSADEEVLEVALMNIEIQGTLDPLHTEVSADEEVLSADVQEVLSADAQEVLAVALVQHFVDEGLLSGLLWVPGTIVERSIPAADLRSILAVVLRSIPAADLRSIPAADLRSNLDDGLRSILDVVLRNTVHADWSSTHLLVDDIL